MVDNFSQQYNCCIIYCCIIQFTGISLCNSPLGEYVSYLKVLKIMTDSWYLISHFNIYSKNAGRCFGGTRVPDRKLTVSLYIHNHPRLALSDLLLIWFILLELQSFMPLFPKHKNCALRFILFS